MSSIQPSVCAATALCLLLTAGSPPLAAGTCDHGLCTVSDCHTPAYGAPPVLWDELQALDLGRLPTVRDVTDFNEHIGNWGTHTYFMSVDVEEDWLFVAANRHVQIWDTRATPANPQRVANRRWDHLGLTWFPSSHALFVFMDIDAPPGDSDVVAVAARQGAGFAAFDTSNKSSPAMIYQDHGTGRWGEQVYAGQMGGRQLAFLAAKGSLGGIFVYDLTAARALPSLCVEAQPSPVSPCPGVFLGRLGTRNRAFHVDGTGDLVAFSSATAANGLEIWNLAVPTQPQRVLQGLLAESVYGVALWKEGTGTFLAAALERELRIYDVSCLQAGPCGLGAPLWTGSKPVSAKILTFSRSGTTPFLYLAGGEGGCYGGDQNEWLYDVSDPTAARDVSPGHRVALSGEPVTYWGWYYRLNGVHGFNHLTPRFAKFSGDILYRSALGVLDGHRWVPEVVDQPFFSDGFESGGFGAWDSAVP